MSDIFTGAGDSPPSSFTQNIDAGTEGKSDDDPRIISPKGFKSKGTSNRTKASIKSAGPTTKQLEEALAELLTMPAIPFTLAGDDFCSNHFLTTGPELAKKLAETSEHNETLRRILERIIVGESVAVLFMGLITYALPPMLHHRMIPGGDVVAPMFGVPVEPKHTHEPNPSANGNPHPNAAHPKDHAAS